MNRSQTRELAFKLLYQIEIQKEINDEDMQLFFENNNIISEEAKKYIKEKVAEDEYLNNVYVRGEISNFKHHYTGHMYFTLKDEGSLIKCIMFKSSTATLNFTPKDGMKVLVLGTVSVFERDRNIPDICKSNERRWDWGPI